jgi:hypothetical protein
VTYFLTRKVEYEKAIRDIQKQKVLGAHFKSKVLYDLEAYYRFLESLHHKSIPVPGMEIKLVERDHLNDGIA